MRTTFFGTMLALGAFAFVAGCGGSSGGGTKPSGDKTVAQNDHGWWCNEHGIKEEDCSMCSAKVAKECKAKGDWCEMHTRAKSQCFICDPSLRAKFAAEYVAKYGKEPPEPTDNMPEKK